MLDGSCLCGDIRWQINGDLTLLQNCHCSMCRKAHGAAFATWAAAPADAFRWIAGEDRITRYASSAGGQRPFCPRCGSPVPSAGADMAFSPAGNLDGPITRPLDNHIFTASRAPWYEITDGAPQFEAYPQDYDAAPVTNAPRPPTTAGATGGSCLCNAVRFEFDGVSERMGHCHCLRCRRVRSAAHSTQLFVPASDFRWRSGENQVRRFDLPEADNFSNVFCPACGSPAPMLVDAGPGGASAMIPAGSLDQDPGCRPMAHIFVGSKAPWFEISDGLPQFDAMPSM